MPLVYAVAIVALALVLLFAIVPLTHWLVDSDLSYVNGDKSADEVLRALDRTRGRIFQVAAGAAALVALTYTGLTYRLSIKSQVIDRYTKAVEGLGGCTKAERAGAVYALEQIAQEVPRYHAVITDILAVFVQNHSRYQPPLAEIDLKRGKPRPEPDVQAALTVLGRRDKSQIGKEHDALRFADCNLRGVNLRKANLQCVRLRRSYLELASLEGADLAGSILKQANLRGADLEGANLSWANLEDAILGPEIKLEGRSLSSTNLANADMESANLKKAKLADVDFRGANLKGAHLAGATEIPTLTAKQLAELHSKHDQTCDVKKHALPRKHRCAGFDI